MPVLDLRLFRGTFRDFARSNDGTPSSTTWISRGRHLYASMGGSEIDCGNDTSLDITGSYTMLVFFRARPVSAVGVMAGRYNDGVNKGAVVQLTATGAVEFNHCVQGSGEGGLQENHIVSGSTYDDDQPHVAVCRFTNGVGSELFVDGASVGTDTTYTTGVASFSQNFYVGRQSGGTSDNFVGLLGAVVLWPEALSNTDIARLSDLINFITPSTHKGNYIIPSSVTGREQGLRGAWHAPHSEGVLTDLANDLGDATVVGRPQTTRGPGGKAIRFPLATYYNYSYKDTGGNLTHLIEFKLEETTTVRTLFTRMGTIIRFNDGGFPGYFAWFPSVIGAPITYAAALTKGLWHQLIVKQEGTSYDIIIDGTSAKSGTATAVRTASHANRIGWYATGGKFIGEIRRVLAFDRAISDDEVAAYHREFATVPNFVSDLLGVPISLINETGGYLSKSPFRIDSGSWKVLDRTDGFPGEREISCVSAGVIWVTSPKAYGTWEFDLYKADTTNPVIMYIAGTIGSNNATGQNGYYFSFGSDESIHVGESVSGTPTDKAVTAASYLSHSTWYRCRVVRRYTGACTIYVKGGTEFPIWTQIDVGGGSGSNPFTDDTTKASNYFCADLDAGDRIANLRFMQGEVHPS